MQHACWFSYRLLCLSSQIEVLLGATIKEPIEKIDSLFRVDCWRIARDAHPAAHCWEQWHKKPVDLVSHLRRSTTSGWLIIKRTFMTTMFVLCVCICKTDAWVIAGVYNRPQFFKRSLAECMYTSMKRKALSINTVSMLDISDSTTQERTANKAERACTISVQQSSLLQHCVILYKCF